MKDPALVARYVRLLRFAWLNPSSAEAQAVMHAFERANADLVSSMNKAAEGPLLREDELRWVLQNLDYFATAAPDRWSRTMRTEDEVREVRDFFTRGR